MKRVCGIAVFGVVTSCATGASLRVESESLREQLDAARRAGAYWCAPRELAIAESHLEFLQTELEEGNSVRAAEHRTISGESLADVLERTRACRPDADQDHDGVPDKDDACPTHPGKVELKGCPDRDNDGIADNVDRCPDVPEDLEGYEDEDGCPEKDRDQDGVLDSVDGCPDTAGPVENKGCPFGDKDGDGVLDDVDKCVGAPEDRDGFEDQDGCPDPDNDGDGIVDASDKCPDQPETVNGVDDADGCPDVKLDLVEIRRDLGKIEIKQKVFFDTGKAKIKPMSFPLLDQIAQVLKTNASMRVLVEGHTDSVGSDAANLKLSDARADAVRLYLVGQGVESARLTSQGFGETKPIESNRTARGREINRRVEFTIVGE